MQPLRYPTEALPTGPSLGNTACFVRTTPAADLDHVWVASTARWYFGRTALTVRHEGKTLAPAYTEHRPQSVGCIYQETGLRVRWSVRLPSRHKPVVALRLSAWAASSGAARLEVSLRGVLGAVPSLWHRRQPEGDDVSRAFSMVGHPGPRCLEMQSSTGDLLRLSASEGTIAFEEPDTWIWSETLGIPPGRKARREVVLEVVSGEAPDRIKPWTGGAVRLDVRTPDAAIDGAVRWAVINSLRVAHLFPAGWGFTNDPPGTYLVTRDAAWFVFGADWYMPGFCRLMLETILRHAQYPTGKIAEFVDMRHRPATREDYGLNIADPTPLLLLALHHHAACTGSQSWLHAVYPAAKRAAAYLQSQMRNGLVQCTSSECTPGRGQCGWRNVLQGISITGAVTELQALSSAALRAVEHMAMACGDPAFAHLCAEAARSAATVLNTTLFDSESGTYRLCLDSEPNRSGPTETLDAVFPLLFGLAPPDIEQSVARRLLEEPWQCPTGLRTAPSTATGYHPSAQWGLVGGSWPNATAWAAAALARTHPVQALRLAHLLASLLFPSVHALRRAGALVPGQFAEWFDGETGESRGMAMSPWMPPTFVWLVVEGLLGLLPTLSGLQCAGSAVWPSAEMSGLLWHGQQRRVVVDSDGLRWR